MRNEDATRASSALLRMLFALRIGIFGCAQGAFVTFCLSWGPEGPVLMGTRGPAGALKMLEKAAEVRTKPRISLGIKIVGDCAGGRARVILAAIWPNMLKEITHPCQISPAHPRVQTHLDFVTKPEKNLICLRIINITAIY